MEKLSALATEATRKEWRDLGFYYISDDIAKEGHLHGNASGLLNFVRSLESYAGNPANAGESEHEHLGPHMYLTLTTWPTAKLDARGVSGQPNDLLRLAGYLRKELEIASSGQVLRVGQQY